MSYTTPEDSRSVLEPVKAVRSTELYYGSGSAGERFLLIDGDDIDTFQLIGAYGNTIKANGARSQYNMTGTIASLNALNHNIIGLALDNVGGTPYDNSTGTLWPELVSFLSQSQDTNIKVFAVCGPRKNILSGSVNRWGIKGGFLKNNQYVENAGTAAKKWGSAAMELSKLSLTYPNLIGWTIDDFAAKNDNIPSYTYRDVQGIVKAGTRWNRRFQFFPTHYSTAATKNAIPAVRLGWSYGFPVSAVEYVGATMRFKMSSDIPTEAVLHLVHEDAHMDDNKENVKKTVKINDIEVWTGDLSGDNRTEVDEIDIQPHLVAGGNTIKYFISGSANGFQTRIWGINARITTNDSNPRRRTLTRVNPVAGIGGGLTEPVFDMNGGVPYSASCCARWKGKPIGETNAAYRYVAACPRTILVYSNHTGAIQNRLGKVFAAYNRNLPDTGLLHVQQGFLFNQNIPPTSHVQKFKSGSAYADGQLIWNYPFYLQQPNAGVFTKRSVPSGLALGGVMTTFPRYQLAIRGHYQRWTTKKEYSGDLKFIIRTEGGGGVDKKSPATGITPYWRTILAKSSSTWPPANPFYNVSGSKNYTNPLSSSTISPASKIVLETFVTSGYGDAYMQARLSASVGSVFLSESAWDFSSGITGSALQTQYTSVKGYYDTIASGRDSLKNKIIHFRRGAWDVYAPSDGDTVFVTADRENRYYDATLDEWTVPSRIIPMGLTVTGTLAVDAAVERGAIFSARTTTAQDFNWAVSSTSASVSWDVISADDDSYYSASVGGSKIHVLDNGLYKVSYGINWYQTGAVPPQVLRSYLVSSSYSAGSGSAAATGSIRTVPASSDYVTFDSLGGGYTRGSNNATFTTNLNSNDIIELYAQHIFGSLPCTTSTEVDQAWITIEKIS